MPISYRIVPGERMVYTAMRGPITADDVVRYRAELGADPEFDPAYSRLVELRDADDPSSHAEIRRMSDFFRKAEMNAVGARRALVVDRGVWVDHVEVFLAYTADSGSDYRLFRDRENALRWLRSEPDSRG
jgi:hypothetical protein